MMFFATAGDQFGLGDSLQSFFFVPQTVRGFKWGAGPALLWRTGTDELLTRGEWAAGPTAVALQQTGPWTVGVLANKLIDDDWGSNNLLDGGLGNDTLVGSRGRDTLVGGAGADDFVFDSLSETGNASSTRDVVLDFRHLTDDIDLRDIDASRVLAGNNTFIFEELATSQAQVLGKSASCKSTSLAQRMTTPSST